MNKIIDVFIMAGGSNSRFGSPKYLETIGNKTILDNILTMIKDVKVDKVKLNPIVIFNSKSVIPNDLKAKKYIVNDGCSGTASMIADYMIHDYNYKLRDSIVMWSDIIITDKIILERLVKEAIYSDGVIIPVVKKSYPYVSVLTDLSGQPFDFYYSKFNGTKLKSGLHDQSMFFFSSNILTKIFTIEKNVSGESDIMDLLKIAYKSGITTNIIKVPRDMVKSFNTVEELNKIKLKLGV